MPNKSSHVVCKMNYNSRKIRSETQNTWEWHGGEGGARWGCGVGWAVVIAVSSVARNHLAWSNLLVKGLDRNSSTIVTSEDFKSDIKFLSFFVQN